MSRVPQYTQAPKLTYKYRQNLKSSVHQRLYCLHVSFLSLWLARILALLPQTAPGQPHSLSLSLATSREIVHEIFPRQKFCFFLFFHTISPRIKIDPVGFGPLYLLR